LTNFNYRARDRYGVLTSGRLEAESPKAAALQLDKSGFMPISITAVETSDISRAIERLTASFQRVKAEELIVFTRQLSSILEAGVPLTEGLAAVAQQITNHFFRAVVQNVTSDIEGGSTFSDALDKHHRVFSPLTVNMIRAGEKAGILAPVLDRISNLLDKEAETGNKIKSATRYPLTVLVTLSMAFIVMTLYVIPKFANFYAAFKAELPLPTRILMAANNVIVNYWYLMIGVVAASVFIFKKVLETKRGRYNWDRLKLSAPVFGPLFSKIYLSRFSRMLSAMLNSGIPILEALTITSATVDNKVISRVIIDIRNEVSQGKSLTEPMKGSEVFPPIAISMVAIGEKAGTLEAMLNKVADYFDRESDYTIKELTPLLEPILVFGLGMLLLLFALGIYLPMWDVIKIYKSF